MTVGGVDTYYDYDEHQWKYRRLGGGPVRRRAACQQRPEPDAEATPPSQPQRSRESADS
ncbi:hypothetical protein GCM10009630_21690 [Kribbella jejuensis]